MRFGRIPCNRSLWQRPLSCKTKKGGDPLSTIDVELSEVVADGGFLVARGCSVTMQLAADSRDCVVVRLDADALQYVAATCKHHGLSENGQKKKNDINDHPLWGRVGATASRFSVSNRWRIHLRRCKVGVFTEQAKGKAERARLRKQLVIAAWAKPWPSRSSRPTLRLWADDADVLVQTSR